MWRRPWQFRKSGHLTHHPAGAGRHLPPGRRDDDAGAGPLDENEAEGLLEIGELDRERGLRDPAALCRPPEMTGIC
jgi:hypothetical protein